MSSYLEAGARERLRGVLDPGSFAEILPPARRVVSPHLAQLDTPVAFDDGVIVGEARLDGKRVCAAAQEGGFMGGAVGEVHGAKLVGLIRRAIDTGAHGVVLLVDSGGVRLHEANAGLIAVSEVMRAVMDARAAGIPVVALVGSANGSFGGMGIVTRCTNAIVMSEEGRLAMSGPEVIETANGVEEFDARDRALVWRTTGGKHRYLLGDAQMLVADDMRQFREAAIAALRRAHDASVASVELTLDALEAEQQMLADRLARFGDAPDALDIWKNLGVAEPETLPMLEADAFRAAADAHRIEAKGI